jgi:hypothetical protein
MCLKQALAGYHTHVRREHTGRTTTGRGCLYTAPRAACECASSAGVDGDALVLTIAPAHTHDVAVTSDAGDGVTATVDRRAAAAAAHTARGACNLHQNTIITRPLQTAGSKPCHLSSASLLFN